MCHDYYSIYSVTITLALANRDVETAVNSYKEGGRVIAIGQKRPPLL